MEFPMPEDHAYEHPLHSYGEPRRLQVIDPNETRRFSIENGYVRPNDRGTQGLIGYTDFYREPPTQKGMIWKVTDENGNTRKEDRRRMAADSNIGFMNVHDDHMKQGIAKEMINHIDRTTDEGSNINMGKAMHDATVYISEGINDQKPGRVTYKRMSGWTK